MVHVITLWGTVRYLWGSFVGCKFCRLCRFNVLLSILPRQGSCFNCLKGAQRLRPGGPPWCELMQLVCTLHLLLKFGCMSGMAIEPVIPIPFSLWELFPICPNAISNGRWWMKRVEQIGPSGYILETDKILPRFSISLVIRQNRPHSKIDPSIASAQHLLKRTSLQSLAHISLVQKTPSLPACDHVAFGLSTSWNRFRTSGKCFSL